MGKSRLNLIYALLLSQLVFAACSQPPSVLGQKTDSRPLASLSQRVWERADWVFNHATDVHYEHLHRPVSQQVSDDGRICRNDCSGFVAYIIHAIGSRHYQPIHDYQQKRNYPQAKAFAHFFASLSTSEPHDGWLRVASFGDLRRGDFIAWEKEASQNNKSAHNNSGHVMIVRDPAGRVFEENINGRNYRMVSIPVIDSSSVYHFPPEILPPNAGQQNRDGLGKGEIRLVLDAEDNPIGYWEGSYWGEGQKQLRRPSPSNVIFFGRMVPLQ